MVDHGIQWSSDHHFHLGSQDTNLLNFTRVVRKPAFRLNENKLVEISTFVFRCLNSSITLVFKSEASND